MYWVCICFRALTLHTIDNAKNEEKMYNYNDVTQLTAYGTNSQKQKKINSQLQQKYLNHISLISV